MRLDQYLVSEGITSSQFASSLGVSVHTVNKWRRKVRIPRPHSMARIHTVTQEKVTPNDWYEKVANERMESIKR